MIHVLFVCLGNICRSPMAEAVFLDMVKKAGLEHLIEVDSAGTSGWHEGETAHRGTLEVLRRNGISYAGRSRRFDPVDVERFDYIVAMDRSNFVDIHRTLGAVQPNVIMFLQPANALGLTDVQEVPDPWYTGSFDEVYELVKTGSAALLSHIRREQHLP